MKYPSNLKNAKSKAERFFRSGFAFLVFICLSVAFIAFFFQFVQNSKANEAKAIEGICQAMETDMAKCNQIGRKMQYAGAEIKDELLPELKVYLYSLSALSDAFYSSFENADAPVSRQFLSKVMIAAAHLEQDYNSGYPAQNSEQALIECLNEFAYLLKK